MTRWIRGFALLGIAALAFVGCRSEEVDVFEGYSEEEKAQALQEQQDATAMTEQMINYQQQQMQALMQRNQQGGAAR